MRCPFLREAQVKYCQASPFRKMIVRVPNDQTIERCSSADYRNCPSLKQHHEDHPQLARCPFLQESLVQYCAASAVTKFIPYSESSIIRCGNDNHRFCELYLSVAAPADVGGTGIRAGTRRSLATVEDIQLPEGISYSANHCWLDRSTEGTCHVGIDGFFSRLLDRVDAVSYLTTRGTTLPTAVVTVHGIDFQLIVPIRMTITNINTSLRSDPSRLTVDPFGSGWLFEGRQEDDPPGNIEPLIRGSEAIVWMKRECEHLSDFFHNTLLPEHSSTQPTMADGGSVHSNALHFLDRNELLQLFNEFFSPYASWRK